MRLENTIMRLMEKFHLFWLTLALVGLMLIGAFSRELPDSLALRVLQLSGVGLLMFSLMSLRTKHRVARRFVLIIGLMLVTVVARNIYPQVIFEYTYVFLLFCFLVLAAWLVAGQVLLTGSVNLNKIVGSIGLYLIIGQVFALFYTALLKFSPGAIRGIEPGPWYEILPDANYFSFVTLTSLGYGDMSPVSPIARVIANLEAVAGVFYLAIIVAGLIGSFKTRPQAGD
jgi:voltage-gated potassium channel